MTGLASALVVVVIEMVIASLATRPDCDASSFLCNDGSRCIDKRQICDRVKDCHDSSDEALCGNQNCTDGQFPCHDGHSCIPRDLVCDLYHDCGDGSDEDVCESRGCKEKPCSEPCEPLQDKDRCACQPGYVIQEDGRCLINGSSPVLYLAAYNKILAYSIRSTNHTDPSVVVDHLNHVHSLASHGKYLYWSDREDKTVYQYDTKEQHPPWKLVDTGLESPLGIAVDTLSNHVYIVDKHRIVACDTHGENCTVVIQDRQEPLDITICQEHRLLIWSEGGKDSGIYKSQLNGNMIKTIIKGSVTLPVRLTWDGVSQKLFWIDSELGTIESVDLNGLNRKIIVSRNIKNPVGIGVIEGMVYWADQDHSSVFSVDKETGRQLLPIVTKAGHVTDVVVDHPILNNVTQDNPCLHHKCSDMCLVGNDSFTCVCPEHKIRVNYEQCEDNPNCLEVLMGDGRSILRYPLCGIGYRDHLKTRVYNDDMRQVVVIGWRGDLVLYRDTDRGVIATIALNGIKSRERILYSGIYHIMDTCVDWNSGVIYWTTGQQQAQVQAGSLLEDMIVTIVNDGVEFPEFITVDFETGHIYIADNGRQPRIMVCYTDGRHCSKLSVSVTKVGSLTYDLYSKRLFYIDNQGTSCIQAMDVKDHHVTTIYHGVRGETLTDLVVTMETVYWIDLRNKTLMSIQKNAIYRMESVILSRLTSPRGLAVRPDMIPSHNLCVQNNVRCDDFCFSTPEGASCRCQDGYYLDNATQLCQKTCKEFVCGDGMCINRRYVCDGHSDCYDSTDEEGCVQTTTSPPTYGTSLATKILVTDTSCDIHNGGCSQICNERNGSSVCSCTDGYNKASDGGRSCVVNGPEPEFVVGTNREGVIRTLDIKNNNYLHIGHDLHRIMSLDVNQHNNDVYFCTEQALTQYVHTSKISHTLKTARFVTDIGYDWVGNNMYLTNSYKKKLLVCGLAGTPVRCKTIIYQEVTRFSLYPEKGIMFTVSTSMKQIRRVGMNGKESRVIITSGLSMPSDIVIDKPANRIYWIDEGAGKVESANLEGHDRYTVIQTDTYHFLSLDVFGDNLYLTDQKLDSLVRLDKLGRNPPTVIMNVIDKPTSVRVVHPLLQQKDRSVCKTLGCSQLCLLTPVSAECSCYDGYLYNSTTSTCTDMKPYDSLVGKGEITHSAPLYQTSPQPSNGSCHLPCRNGGTCLAHGPENSCVCSSGFKGKLCEIPSPDKKRPPSSVWVLGVVLAVVGIVLTSMWVLCYYKCRRRGFPYIRVLCRTRNDEEELIPDTEVVTGSLFTNGQYQEMNDINYPDDYPGDCHSSSESLDSAFVSKREDSDSESANSTTSNSGYTQLK